MSETARALCFKHFRGLPDNKIDLKGRNLVVLGCNGKGKSAVVDGFEFLFSGKVSRFTGVGTGSIEHDDAVQHVQKKGTAKVSLLLSPSNGEISRTLAAETTVATNSDPVRSYLAACPNTDSFILRRGRILDFICDQDADRYQKFVRLLGLSRIDVIQRAFVEAENAALEDVERNRRSLAIKLAQFNDAASNFNPQSSKNVLEKATATLQHFGIKGVVGWDGVAKALPLLRQKRPAANREELDALTRAIITFETSLPVEVQTDIDRANTWCSKLLELEASSEDAPRKDVIAAGTTYLREHPDETICPLCEEPFQRELGEVLERLQHREEALRELTDITDKRQAAVHRIRRFAELTAEQLKKDLGHESHIDKQALQSIRNARASALRWMRSLSKTEETDALVDIALPDRFAPISGIRTTCLKKLITAKKALEPKDTSQLEAAITLVEKAMTSKAALLSAEEAVASASSLASRAAASNAAFTAARESAIQAMFTRIADTVISYYQRLHDFDDENERSECTGMNLKPTSRAAAGGLRLVIEFLGLRDGCDPRAFLSEGHLDSLGLCLFLASVRLFNQKGTLLVLDDVLTSVDKDHRRRVGELLFEEFADYQIVLTTHDEHWYDILQSSALARGVQKGWTFQKFGYWTVDHGPSQSASDASWDFIDEHLTEQDYRELGGPFRLILEDFVFRTAAKIELKVKYKYDGRYTVGDFHTAGFHHAIRDELKKCSPEEESEITKQVGRVFGQGDLVNFLSHANPGRLEVTFDQARDFVSGVRELTKLCEAHKLIRGK